MEDEILSKINQMKNFNLITSTSQMEKYILDLANTIKKKTEELSEFNPLNKIKFVLFVV